jgi:hypothetical protein
MCAENRNWAVLIGTTLLSLCGCGGGSAPSQGQPTPVQLFSVSPLPTTFEPAFTMQINGAGFAPGAVLIGAVDQGGTTSTTFVSSTLLQRAHHLAGATRWAASPARSCCLSAWDREPALTKRGGRLCVLLNYCASNLTKTKLLGDHATALAGTILFALRT